MRKQDGTEIFEGVVGEVSPTGKGVYPKKFWAVLPRVNEAERGRRRQTTLESGRRGEAGGGGGEKTKMVRRGRRGREREVSGHKRRWASSS